MKFWGLSSSASKLATIYFIRYLRSFPKNVLELFIFTLLCFWFTSERKAALPRLGSKWNFIFDFVVCLGPAMFLISSFISVTRGISATSEYQTVCFFFPVVRGREIHLPTVHCYMKAWNCRRGKKMLQLFFLIIRHVSCFNISFCHHYRIVFLNIMW